MTPKEPSTEPTIEWLIDEIAPNEGNSPLLNFNKQRLKALIASRIREVVDSIERELPEKGTGHAEGDEFGAGRNMVISEVKQVLDKYRGKI